MSGDHRALLERSLRQIRELRAELEARRSPVAIVGIGCRFPGGGDGPRGFWNLLREGRDAVGEVPPERFDVEAFYDPRPGTPGKTNSRWGAFLDGVEDFDAAFFGISPREAAAMDPQQRLLLEIACEALEDAGQPLGALSGSRSGVFVGIYNNDYFCLEFARPELADVHAGTGTGASFAAGRLSYLLDLHGPSVSLDTVCSASLVAVHLGCRALAAGDCDVALAGGTNLVLSPLSTVMNSQLQALAPDGRCKTFDARANGYVRGEGCGVVVLKRLADARRDGDRIWAVIRGSAVSHDGRGAGLTAPNGAAQAELLRRALADAGLEGSEVDYFEAHGTGTALGDPIEFEALRQVYGAPRPAGQSAALGSVKTNLGHLEAAAGIAGLVKAVLVLHHGEIPPHLHLRQVNPRIELEGTPFVIPTAVTPFPHGARPRRAAVSSFGLSGTLAHVILEEAPAAETSAPVAPERPAHILPLAARHPGALAELASQYQQRLEADPPPIADLAGALAHRRDSHSHRLAVVGAEPGELAAALAAWQREPTAIPAVTDAAAPVFVFPGQGCQWLGMGRELMACEEVFRAELERCAEAFAAEVEWSLLDELMAGDAASRLAEVDVAQPMIFALQVSLAALWRSWGVVPGAVVGLSMGEVAAARVAGILSLADAAKVICRRSRVLRRRAAGRGGMALVELGAEAARRAIADHASSLSLAVAGGPRSSVVSGDEKALDAVLAELEASGVYARRVKVDYASHSPAMEPLRAELGEVLAGLEPQPAQLPFHSTLTGEVAAGEELGSEYWIDNLCRPVLFWDVLQGLAAAGRQTFVEISPHPIQLPAVVEGMRHLDRPALALASTRRPQESGTGGERRALLESLAVLYAAGHDPDWHRVAPPGRHVDLPTYPWQRRRFWLDGSPPRSLAACAPRLPGTVASVEAERIHPFFTHLERPADRPKTRILSGRLSLGDLPWLADHRVFGAVVVPAAAFVEMALAGAATVLGDGPVVISDLSFERALAVPEEGERGLQMILEENAEGFELAIYGGVEDGWERCASGVLHAADETATSPVLGVSKEHETKRATALDVDALRAAFAARGIEFGPTFCGLTKLRRDGDTAWGQARLDLEGPSVALDYRLHPALLDAAFQVLGAFGAVEEDGETWLPVGVERLRYEPRKRPPVELECRASRREARGRVGDLRIVTASEPLLDVWGLTFRRLATAPGLAGENWLWAPRWRSADEDEPAAVAKPTGRWLVLCRGGDVETLRGALEERGAEVVVRQSRGPGDARRSLALPAAGDGEWRGVVLVTGRDDDNEALADAALDHLEIAVTVARELVSEEPRHVPRLFLVAPAGSGPASVLRGLRGSLALEHPELRPVWIEREETATAGALADELLRDSEEDQVRLAAGGRRVARLERWSPAALGEAARGAEVERGAAYLLSGGLGGLGRTVAGWLAERGAGHLVLLGRSAPAAEIRRELAGLEAEVHVVQGDVTRPEDIVRALAAVPGGVPLRGVLHVAGVLADATLLRLDRGRMERVLAPKVAGAWNLHCATADYELDFFVLFSSAAAVLGSPAQGHYAAANAFLDALAEARQKAGQPGLSLAWGPWSRVGLAAERAAGEGFHGFGEIAPEAGLAVLERLLESGAGGRLMVAPFDPRQWREHHPAAGQAPFLAAVAGDSGGVQAGGELRLRLAAAAPQRRRRLLAEHLRAVVAEVLRLDSDEIAADVPLASLGLESLMALELRNRLESSLGLRLSATLAWSHPTLEALGAHLGERLAEEGEDDTPRGVSATATTTDDPDLERLLAEIEELPDDEARRRLASSDAVARSSTSSPASPSNPGRES